METNTHARKHAVLRDWRVETRQSSDDLSTQARGLLR